MFIHNVELISYSLLLLLLLLLVMRCACCYCNNRSEMCAL